MSLYPQHRVCPENMLINEGTYSLVNMHLLKLYYDPGTTLQSEGAAAEQAVQGEDEKRLKGNKHVEHTNSDFFKKKVGRNLIINF